MLVLFHQQNHGLSPDAANLRFHIPGVNANKSRLISSIVRLLCEHGADVNAVDYFGLRPIHLCAVTMNLEAAEYLLQEHKAQINALDFKDRTALYYVATNANPNPMFAKMLIERGGKLGKEKLKPLPREMTTIQRRVRDMVAKV
jgi:ankyrin repeat protein